MNQAPYPYRRELDTKYTFVSEGKRPITKVVEFFVTDVEDLYCLGFGDLLDDSNVDDTANSNNGDIVKVIATVFKIAEKFMEEFPKAKVYFTGSTPARILLYNRALKTNYGALIKKFRITGFKESENGLIEETYNELDNSTYVLFSLKTKNRCVKEKTW